MPPQRVWMPTSRISSAPPPSVATHRRMQPAIRCLRSESLLVPDTTEALHLRHHRRSVVLAGVSGPSSSEASRVVKEQRRASGLARTEGAGDAEGGLPRRALLAAAGGFLLTGSSVGTAPTAAASPSPVQPFCGVGGGLVPMWAYKTDFDQFLIDFNGYKTYVRTVGSPPKKGVLSLLSGGPKLNPALVIHGGPGLSSAYLESLELLAADGRQIIFYDQIGCGKSFEGSNYSAPAEYSVDLFLSELDTIRCSPATTHNSAAAYAILQRLLLRPY
uniref:AB hydrolase-1 domain-containing protein n=1 Tax=Tetraselmis chuii TaxID=63592 RepID=A0A7S1T040_9CHLO|mmetsp:Transcript_38418/g.68889  ORF Transcript_38418/g.68889 Transcript_38418/m.68889 type:complete len:274 (+) Transcript_38418:112-933(+)